MTAMERAILKRAEKWGGLIDESDLYSDGDRYGRLTRKQIARNASVAAAMKSLEESCKIEFVGQRIYRIVAGGHAEVFVKTERRSR